MIIKTGDKFSKLTAIKFDHKDKRRDQYWIFQCDCGNKKIIRVADVKNKHTKSCGCLKKLTIHGMEGTRTYKSWASMKNRCLNPNTAGYKNWGGRGIKICERWMEFKNFLADMKIRPENTSLDRINNNGNYCKSNCRWADPKIQRNNQRNFNP